MRTVPLVDLPSARSAMMDKKIKNVLVVFYTQTGQLGDVVKSVTAPLLDADNIKVHYLRLKPKTDYPSPWPFFEFFDVFPESVYLDPPELETFDLQGDEVFDLVILSYQVWFLAPSLPVTAFLQSEVAHRLLKNRPVITVIGCRNMWTRAQETVKKLLLSAEAILIDNVVFLDQGSTLASFITTPRWLWTGKRNAFLGFPPAGISEADIKDGRRFGVTICKALAKGLEKSGQPLLTGLSAVDTKLSLIQAEIIAHRSFRIWGRLIRKIGKPGDPNRRPVLLLYFIFLLCIILTVVPINLILKSLLSPLLKKKHATIKQYYELPSGSGVERMGEY